MPEPRYEWYILKTALQRFTAGSRNKFLGLILSNLDDHSPKNTIPCPIPINELAKPINLDQDLRTYLRNLAPPETKARITQLLTAQAPHSTLEPFLNRRVEERTISWEEQSRIFNHHTKKNPKFLQKLFSVFDCLYMVTGIRSVPFTQFGHPIFAVQFRRIQRVADPSGIIVDPVALYSPVMGVFGKDGGIADVAYGDVAPGSCLGDEPDSDIDSILEKKGTCGMDFVYILYNEEVV